MKKRVTLRIEEHIHKMVVEVAKIEQRDVNQMYCMLAFEAVMARRKKKKKEKEERRKL